MLKTFIHTNDDKRITIRDDDDYEMHCPFCGHFNTHIVSFNWTDGYGVNFDHSKRREFSDFKQGHLELIVRCEYEGNHQWSYVFGEHKGFVFFQEQIDYDKIKPKRKPIPARLRFKILKRDNFICQYCGATKNDGIKLQVDHIKPVSKGGTDDEINLITACQDCNLGKSDIELEVIK